MGRYLRSAQTGGASSGIVGPDSLTVRKTIKSTQQYDASGLVEWAVIGTDVAISSTGLLTVNSATAGTLTATIHARSNGQLFEKVVTITVSDTIPVFPAATLAATVRQGASFSSDALKTAVNSGTVTHSLESGTLPAWATLAANGTLSGTVPAAEPLGSKEYVFTVKAVSGTDVSLKTVAWGLEVKPPVPTGQQLFGTNVGPGTYSWTCPNEVEFVSVVAVGGGGAGQDNWANPCGSGGGLGWKNNIPVVPGQVYTVVVGAGGTSTSTSASAQLLGGNSYFINTNTVCGYGGGNASGVSSGGPNHNQTYGGGWQGDGGGAGGYAGNYQGGGGAGGYTARGGNGRENYSSNTGGGGHGGCYYSSTYGTGSGGGVGLDGQGISGRYFWTPWTGSTTDTSCGGGGEGGSGGGRGLYGENPWSGSGESSGNLYGGNYGGGGGGPGTSWPNASGNGGQGGVRIIWGTGRAFPATNTQNL